MQKTLGLGARIFAVAGALICLVAGAARIAGSSYIGGFESMTLFTAGMAAMLFSVMLKLESL